MAWSLSGRNIEHCNCNSICPCYSSGLARPGDEERCIGFIAFEIEAGQADGVDLSGRRAVFVQDSPGAMAEGNWKVGIIVDDEATDEQADHLAQILTGAVGGPMEAFGQLTGEMVGVERAPVTISHDGHGHTIRVGSLIDAEFQDELHEGATEPVQLTNTPGVPFSEPITISPPTKSVIKAFGIDIDNSGKHGTTATFDWSA